MGVIVNKNDELEDELSRRISADLRGRMNVAAEGKAVQTDFSELEYTKDLKKTGRFSWVWIVLVVLAILSLISIVFF